MRRRRVTTAAGPPEWPPFEPRLVPSPEPVRQPNAVPVRRNVEWIVPGPDGAVPDCYPVKVKVSSGIFHVPGGRFYERTTADRCYPSADVGRGRRVPSVQVLSSQIATIEIATRRRTS